MVDTIEETWTNFKSLLATKSGELQYTEILTDYVIWFTEGIMRYECIIPKVSPASSDQEDFEDNYKDDANKPVTAGEDHIAVDVEIRNTSETNSDISDSRGFIPKTVVVENNLNEDVSIQVCGSREVTMTKHEHLGDAFIIAAGETGYATLSDYFPFLRAHMTCSTAPTTGEINIYLLRVKS